MHLQPQLCLQVPTGQLGSLRLLLELQQLVQRNWRPPSVTADLPICVSALASVRPAS